MEEGCAQLSFRALHLLCPICRGGIFDEATVERVREEHRLVTGGDATSEVDESESDDPEDSEYLLRNRVWENAVQQIAWEAAPVMNRLNRDCALAEEDGDDDDTERIAVLIYRYDQAIKQLGTSITAALII